MESSQLPINTVHGLGSGQHTPATVSQLAAKLSDADAVVAGNFGAPSAGMFGVYTTAWVPSVRAWGIATTSTAGAILGNTTPATVGVPVQYSPTIQLDGTAWKSNAVAESQVGSWRIESRPVSGATIITGALVFTNSRAGGAYVSGMSLSHSGNLTASWHTGSSGLAVGNNSTGTLQRSDTLTGLGVTLHYRMLTGNYPIGFINNGRADAANNIVGFTCYDRGVTAITNAATMRLHSFGWTDDTNAYHEEGARFCDGHTTQTGADLVDVSASASGATSRIVGTSTTEGLKEVVQEETLSPVAVETAMATVIPKGSVIKIVLGNCDAALTGGGTTVTWSLGTAADPDKYGSAGFPTQADSLIKNSKSSWVAGALTRLAADETIVLTGTVTGGAADGDTALTVGSVRIMVVYDTFAELEDAA